MGLNVDLTNLYGGMPKTIPCPDCDEECGDFEEFDIECHEPVDGRVETELYCPECDKSWPLVIQSKAAFMIGKRP